jgi:hypothetical protein
MVFCCLAFCLLASLSAGFFVSAGFSDAFTPLNQCLFTNCLVILGGRASVVLVA